VRICIIGKFPPIQGGVSMRIYWTAHALAARGHEVHVVTNAKEAGPPFRMHMRKQDWERCAAVTRIGSVSVHWSDPVDASQAHIPMASPFVSKLAAIAARVHAERPFDVVFSHYLEPYGVAGHLAAEIAGVPHVVRMAGSDAGRLWHHPQLETLYDHVLRKAETVIASGRVAERAVARGVDPARIAFGGGFAVPEALFAPDGPRLDLPALRREAAGDDATKGLMWGDFAAAGPYFGICGKLGDTKGSFALLAAMRRLKDAGLDVGLVALAHGQEAVEASFRARARKLKVADRILQIPFLPHWRVPEFIRGALAICCLEQDFPISFHSPIIPREVLLCGACLVASTEMIRKFPEYRRLPHGYGCVAIADVNDIDALSESLGAIVRDPGPARAVGARGRVFARELQRDIGFPEVLEGILETAAARQRIVPRAQPEDDGAAGRDERFRLTEMAACALHENGADPAHGPFAAPGTVSDLGQAREVLAALERGMARGDAGLERFALAVRTEIAIAAAEEEADKGDPAAIGDPLFRLRIGRWGLGKSDVARLVPVREPGIRVVAFDYDVAEFMTVKSAAELPVRPARRPSHLVVFAGTNGPSRSPLLVDDLTAQILKRSDGTRTATEIVKEIERPAGKTRPAPHLAWIERLFAEGLIRLQVGRGSAVRTSGHETDSATDFA
jgi:glycosyltransferase involved in cell wall biosynthesis